MSSNRSLEKNSFLYGTNGDFIAELYERYVQDPASVDPEWLPFFQELGDDVSQAARDWKGPSWTPSHRFSFYHEEEELSKKPAPKIVETPAEGNDDTVASIRALMLIRAYRVRGHLEANLDPLGLTERHPHPELDPAAYGFTAEDWDKKIFINSVLGLEYAILRKIMGVLRKTYCGPIGIEFMHIQRPEQKQWLQLRMENAEDGTRAYGHPPAQRLKTLDDLIGAIEFERFLDVKYKGAKRFGLDGGESSLAALEAILAKSSELGIIETHLGMAHRGRLNILANTLRKSLPSIFAEFKGDLNQLGGLRGSGDVKYHLGASGERVFNGRPMHVSLCPNPSHLEVVDPVVMGRVRAKQSKLGDTERAKIMGILLHGDAAFCGQGLVPETLDLSGLDGYRTGGTIHLIINNQIGFTTSPTASRSSPYSSDIAKGIQAPILHVNGDDPDAVIFVAEMAAEYRHTFKEDVVIDLFCYRRHGHNEMDEPSFTQPIMYRTIKEHPDVSTLYAQKLIEAGLLTQDKADTMVLAKHDHMQKGFDAVATYKAEKEDWLTAAWAKITPDGNKTVMTGCALGLLKEVGTALSESPKDYTINTKIIRLLQSRRDMITTERDIDWATGEALALGTLLCDGHPVRLSGQDCSRGTFSQRHATLIDQMDERIYIPLNHIRPDQKHFEVINSPLSEAGVLGFEYGYSMADPDTLTIWEAQFGDFANGAQVVIDQFVVSAETKWYRKSGLVMLLPHGFEGQGPEHSSARLERYLQLCAEDNLRVANCTTPANYFHILRRQLVDTTRKPLILMTPKSLLRLKAATSTLAEMGPKTTFLPVIGDRANLDPTQVKRVVLCSGKVYYDLAQHREATKQTDCALLRLEQLYPFPEEELANALKVYKNAEIIWCQEEPENNGAWHFLDRRLERVLATLPMKSKRPRYIGRPEAASPATGLAKRHEQEQAHLVMQTLTV